MAAGKISLDTAWFHGARAVIDTATTIHGVSPIYRSAFYFMRSPIRDRIKNHRGFQVNMNGEWRPFEGLTSQLSKTFYPCDNYHSTGGARTGGSRRGCLVDREIADLVNKGTLPTDGALHWFTCTVLKFLKKNNLQPFASQVPVFDEHLELATTLDILCIDHGESINPTGITNNIVNVQLKTGFERNYESACGKLVCGTDKTSHLNQVEDSYYMRHQIQLLMEITMLRKMFTQGIRRSIVLVASESGRQAFPLDRKIHQLATDIYTALGRRKQETAWDIRGRGMRAQAAYRKMRKVTK